MGVGKTTVGSLLAKQLNYKLLDTDKELERQTGASVSLIFDIEGEAGFRKREQEVISQSVLLDNVVIATGGGAILLRENREALRANSVVVYLQGGVDTLTHRTRMNKNRPLLNTSNPKKTIEQILRDRVHLYEEMADIQVTVDDLSAERVVSTITGLLP